MNIFRKIRRMVKDTNTTVKLLEKMREEVAFANAKVKEVSRLQQIQLDIMLRFVQQVYGHDVAKSHFKNLALNMPGQNTDAVLSFEQAMAGIPLLLADKTYNTAHPDYDANLVRNYPGCIFNADRPSKNLVYHTLLPRIRHESEGYRIQDSSWQPILEEAMNELQSIPHASEVFARKTFIENYVVELKTRYDADYMPGWVNLEDALFLYWLVRQQKPKTIVQTGVCNGLSSAFMMLALAKNGPEGKLYVMDLPAVFDPKNPDWTVKNNVYGVLIPEGKSSGWMVPDAYHDRFEVQLGDAKQLLPPLIDKLESVDMFYHDSDHTYQHMMFEFNEVKRKLAPGGLIVADDISWNASVWDFADAHQVPSYNYKGTMGVAFF